MNSEETSQRRNIIATEIKKEIKKEIKIEDTLSRFNREFALIIIGALIFTASFLWKDFFTEIEEHFVPKHQGLLPRFIFLLVVSLVLVGSAVHLRNVFDIKEKDDLSNTFKFDDSPID